MIKPTTIINSLIIAAALLVGVFLVLTRVDTYLKMKAVDDCGKISKYQKNITAEDATASYPVVDVYKGCLKDKGL